MCKYICQSAVDKDSKGKEKRISRNKEDEKIKG